jgi:hypothetical protein
MAPRGVKLVERSSMFLQGFEVGSLIWKCDDELADLPMRHRMGSAVVV